MADRDTVADLLAQAYTYDLEMPKSLQLASLDAVVACYNGIGPEWLPVSIRNLVTDHFGYFRAGAMVHDWEYAHEGDRSHKAFTAANDRLEANCRKLLQKGVPWYKRWLYRERPKMLAMACQSLGWDAWNEAA